MSEMKSWSGKKIDFKAWWNPKKGSVIQGVLMQRNRASGGSVRTPFYVLQLTKACAEGIMRDKALECAKNEYMAVPENNALIGLDELLGCEVKIKSLDATEFTTDDGEVRMLKQFEVEHSTDIINQEAAKRRPSPR